MKKTNLKIKTKIDDSKLNWFWRITTKWYFFPFYYLLVFLLSRFFIIYDTRSSLDYFRPMFYAVPLVILYILGYIIKIIHYKISLSAFFSLLPIIIWIYHILLISIFVFVPYYRIKKVILKKLILILIIFLPIFLVVGLYIYVGG